LALHSGLSTSEQLEIFEPTEDGCRKVIVATNIAEVRKKSFDLKVEINIIIQASITIEGVKFVIDCGFVKASDAHWPSEALTVVLLAQDFQSYHWICVFGHDSNLYCISYSTGRSGRSHGTRCLLPSVPFVCISVPSTCDLTRDHSHGFDNTNIAAQITWHR
jgi:Helicase conserved C-terminal domain